MRVLISQERPGHTETIASFVQNFTDLGYEVDVCSPDAYQNLTLYHDQGMRFAVVAPDAAFVGVNEGRYRAIVFNSAHLTLPKEGGAFSIKLLRRLEELNFDRRRILRLHHSHHSAKTLSGFVELGTSSLMAAITEFCYTPYARIRGFSPDPGASPCLALLGGAYQGAQVHRNLEKIRDLGVYLDRYRSPLRIKWYLTGASSEMVSMFGNIECFEMKEGLATAEILDDLKHHRSYMGTFLNRATRYHKQSLTGTMTFAVNAGIPFLLDQQLSSVYGVGGIGLLERNSPAELERSLLSRSEDEYMAQVASTKEFRNRQIQANIELLGAILSKSI